MSKLMLIFVAGLLAAGQSQNEEMKVGSKMPAFELKDAFGRKYKLDDFIQPVLVFFYEGKQSQRQNEWIKKKLGGLVKEKKLSQKKLAIIGIANFQETAAPAVFVRAFLRKEVKKTKALILCDEDGGMMKRWGFRNGRSNIYILNKGRKLVWKSSGALDKRRGEQLVSLIRRLVNR